MVKGMESGSDRWCYRQSDDTAPPGPNETEIISDRAGRDRSVWCMFRVLYHLLSDTAQQPIVVHPSTVPNFKAVDI